MKQAYRASSFDAGAIPGILSGGSIVVGEISFLVNTGTTTSNLNIFYVGGLDSVNDNVGGVFFPSGSATVIVPEPGTAALMGLGLLALGMVGRSRS